MEGTHPANAFRSEAPNEVRVTQICPGHFLGRIHKGARKEPVHCLIRMIGLIIGQLFKLEDALLRQAVSGIHIVLQNGSGSIIPVVLIIEAVLVPVLKGIVDQTLGFYFVIYFVVYNGIPVQVGHKGSKMPVGMCFLQGIQRLTVAFRELVYFIEGASYISVGHRQGKCGYQGRVQAVCGLPLLVTFIRTHQIIPLYVTGKVLLLIVEADLRPQTVVRIQGHAGDKHSLSAVKLCCHRRRQIRCGTHGQLLLPIQHSHDFSPIRNGLQVLIQEGQIFQCLRIQLLRPRLQYPGIPEAVDHQKNCQKKCDSSLTSLFCHSKISFPQGLWSYLFVNCGKNYGFACLASNVYLTAGTLPLPLARNGTKVREDRT